MTDNSKDNILQPVSNRYEALVSEIGVLLESARGKAAQAVNTVLVDTYWQVGRYIVEYEQQGRERAEYGSNLLNRLSADLTQRYGLGSVKAICCISGSFILHFKKVRQCLTF